MPNENVTRDWISYLEAQRLSGLSWGTLRSLIRTGQLCTTKVGGATMIDKHSLEEYMCNHGYAEQLRLFE